MTPEMEMQNRLMAALAASLDEYLNGHKKGDDRVIGFVLLTFPFGVPLDRPDTGVNYVSNGDRAGVKASMERMLERWEDSPTIQVAKKDLG